VDEVAAELTARAVPRLVAAAAARRGLLPPADEVARPAAGTAAARVAGAALEMAVLDAETRHQGVTLAVRLGASGRSVTAGTFVGLAPDGDVGPVVAAVDAAVDAGFRRVRLKIAPGCDVEPVRAVRRQHPRLVLQADANGAYAVGAGDTHDAARLRELEAFGLTCLEQPLDPADLGVLAGFARTIAIPIALDESLSSVSRVGDALECGAMSVACIKPGRLGGLLAARQAVTRCAAAGIGAFLGGFYESGLGRSANLALGGLAGLTLPGDLAPPSGYLADDPFTYPVLDRATGTVAPPASPGVVDHGAATFDDLVAGRAVLARHWIPAGARGLAPEGAPGPEA
jgi:O-succinylbenzoate synthase